MTTLPGETFVVTVADKCSVLVDATFVGRGLRGDTVVTTLPGETFVVTSEGLTSVVFLWTPRLSAEV